MRHLNAEHISVAAAFLIGSNRIGLDITKAVATAIKLQREAEKQCAAANEQLDKEGVQF